MRIWIVMETVDADWGSSAYEITDSAVVFDNEAAALEFQEASGRAFIQSYDVYSDITECREIWRCQRRSKRKTYDVGFVRYGGSLTPPTSDAVEVFATSKKSAIEAATIAFAEFDRSGE